MTRTIVVLLAALIVVGSASASKLPDPRVCDGHTAGYCSQQAASIVAWKAEMRAIGSPTPWSPACVAVKASLLQYRCFLQHGLMSGPAGLVKYDASSFSSTVSFGPSAVAFIAAAKARVAAARAGNG